MKMDGLRLIAASSVDFPIFGADPSGPFVLKSAEGLGPTEVNVRMSQTVFEKANYQGRTAALRQVTMLVGLQPNWDEGQTPEQLRTLLYSLMTPRYGGMVRLEIVHEGAVQGYAQGYISKMEPAVFTKDPAIMIVMDCDYPYFLAPEFVVQSPTPYSFLGGGAMAVDIVNEGTAPSGFRAGFQLTSGPVQSLILSEGEPLSRIILIDGITLNSGDKIVIDTRPGSRGIWKVETSGALTSILNHMSAVNSEWLQLYGGTNRLVLSASFQWLAPYYFTHEPAFWGV